MPSFRGLRLAAAVAVVGSLTAACGLGGSSDSADGSSSAAGKGPLKGTITFETLQLKPTFTKYVNGVIDGFEKKNPGVKVKWIDIPFQGAQEKLTTDATAGTLPDVVNLNPQFAQPLEQKGLFVDMDSAAAKIKGDYIPGAWQAFTVPGKSGSYGIPWYLTSEVTMYNKNLFKKAGLDPRKPPATFDELLADGKKLSTAGKGSFYGIHPALENRFITDLAKQGVPLLDDSGKKWIFNTPDAAAYLGKLVKAYKGGVYPKDSLTQDHSKETEAYQAGTVGLLPSGPNFLTIIKQNAPKVAKATGVGPQITGSDGVTNMSVMGLLVPKSSKNQRAGLAFASYMANSDNQLAFSKIVTVLPSVTEALKDPYFTADGDGSVDAQARKISAEQIAKAQNLVPVQFDDRVKQAVLAKIQLALQGRLSPQKALDQAVEAANAITNS
ncbi:sugar ABC transporter substrate-binding protein [Streptomyces sp. VRA16 Mangrove soil]|uniref:ABC transporter substrate-binding protein n=1 Tax=Streptomyces sp. VRA16 Mangrove soil TaxID=2817434 RepID=UPI001A9D5688|nr:sugar ABC transporter substrate-binding protein [Streptomyces sp. VRA16 Mangrove soil]MBO1332310.1 sugar ABC transporter substrate-binding protein [Streptomyces sp. VRA16 Mangrove soil]